MSKLERISTFISVVEENGFAAAARKQGVSTAAVSRQVSRLEADLKAELLQRTTRQLSLTAIGANYYQQCKQALVGIDEAEKAIAGSLDEPTGELRVTSNRYSAMQYLIPHLPQFMALYPRLQVHLELAERFPDLAKENVDLLFGVSIEGPEELVRRQVATTRYVLCASPAYLEKHGFPKTPAELNKHFYITHSMRKPDNSVVFKGGKTVYVKPHLWLNDSGAMYECAIQGMGIVYLHNYIVADALKAGLLVEVLTEFSEGVQPIYLYYRQSKYLQPKIRRFIDFYVK
jgi:DNA-binding transcriptional LysR family regulator